jgi:hypothetical protein
MHTESSNTRRFLYAAKLAELKTLKQLSDNCQLVTVICGVIHEFQKERGVSNVYLASMGMHYLQRRFIQIQNSQNAQQLLMEILNRHYIESKQNTDNYRLLFSITLSLQGIDNLTKLRKSVEKHKITPLESTQAYCRLIGSLISIIFEAANISSDTGITMQLVALFNFIQAKEYAGQERAWGAIGFAESHFTEKIYHQLHQLQDSQIRSIDVFLEYTDTSHQTTWQTLIQNKVTDEVVKFRQLISQLRGGDPVSSEISEAWYESTTQRIDQMYLIESSLSQQLIAVSIRKVKESETELKAHKTDMERQVYLAGSSDSPLTTLFKLDMPGLLGVNSGNEHNQAENSISPKKGNHLQKPIYDLLLKQSRRIEEMSGELDVAKQSLSDQKLVNRAKLLLIQQLKLSETEAHHKIQQAAMKKGLTLVGVAENIIKVSKGKFAPTTRLS